MQTAPQRDTTEPILPIALRSEQEARGLWRGFGDAWTLVGTLVTGIGLWGGVGYLLDRTFGTWPVLFVVGALVGNFAGIYLIYVKSFRDQETS